jgi:hypothetical protein
MTIKMRKLIRQTGISLLLITIVGLTFASKGGGGDKKKGPAFPFKSSFTPIRTTNGFTLKVGPAYTGSYLLGQDKAPGYISLNTITTYQKGNTIFVLPYKYKVTASPYLGLPGKTNLQVLDFRIQMHK